MHTFDKFFSTAVWTILAAYLLHIGAAAAAVPAMAALYDVGPIAGWVTPGTPEYDAPGPAGGLRNGAHILLYDVQVNVLPRGDETYVHVAMRVSTPDAVEANSQINLDVNPDFQSLRLHYVRILRGGVGRDQLASARITALQRETQLEYRIYDGRHAINILLEDLRPGDVLEYAYTLHSVNPAFPEHYAARFDFGGPDSVHCQRLRIRHAATRPLHHRVYGASARPSLQERDGVRELQFEWRDLVPNAVDSNTPPWYSPWPYVALSDRDDWSAVAREVDALYAVPTKLDSELVRVIGNIRDADDDAASQVMKALQFVQESIRYTSIAIGPGSHRPTAPLDVLRRRFGDCKDKTLLLVTMLRALGISARPALVHSRRGRELPQALPTPLAFDHAIVRVSLGGRTYWLDGTRSKETLPLAALESPMFAYALVLDAEAGGLEAIPPPAPEVRRKEVQHEIDARAGMEAPATFTVSTRYLAAAADVIRHELSRRYLAQREKDYLEYYAQRYPGTTSGGPITVDDDGEGDAVTVRETYRLEHAFTRGDDDRLLLYVEPDEIAAYATTVSATRDAPLALAYPVSIVQSIRIVLPEEWSVQATSVQIDNPAFRYRSEARYHQRTLELRYEYEALSDHVSLAQMDGYVQDLERMRRNLGYSLSYDRKRYSLANIAIAPAPLTVLLVALGLGTWIAVRRIHRYDPPPMPAAAGARRGIGGWLLIPALQMCLLPPGTLVLFGGVALFTEAGAWQNLPLLVKPELRAWSQAVMLAFVAGAGLLLPISIAVANLFFRKRTSAPHAFIALFWTVLISFPLLTGWLVAAGIDRETGIGSLVGETLRNFITTLIWTAYMLRSQRVRATFVNRLHSSHPRDASDGSPPRIGTAAADATNVATATG